MEILTEAFPFVFGVLLGVTLGRISGWRRRLAPWALASIALGSFATLASGEWRLGPLYFAFDIGLVMAVSLSVIAAVQLTGRRARPKPGT